MNKKAEKNKTIDNDKNDKAIVVPWVVVVVLLICLVFVQASASDARCELESYKDAFNESNTKVENMKQDIENIQLSSYETVEEAQNNIKELTPEDTTVVNLLRCDTSS